MFLPIPARMDRRTKTSRPRPATRGEQVLRLVDSGGAVSFAGTGYRVGNRYRGQTVAVAIVGDTVQISQDGILLRTHEVRHDLAKEFGALSRPKGKPLTPIFHVDPGGGVGDFREMALLTGDTACVHMQNPEPGGHLGDER